MQQRNLEDSDKTIPPQIMLERNHMGKQSLYKNIILTMQGLNVSVLYKDSVRTAL